VALRRTRSVFLVIAVAITAGPALAVDSRVEKARQIRDEILEKRRGREAGTAVRPDLEPAEDPFQASVRAARERLGAIDVQIEDKRRQSQAVAAPREKLQARSDELAQQASAVQEQNRARVEAIYRSAKLGAGAAGWHPEPARSARLSRYLAAIAEVQQKKLELVEIEHGSVIASLDKARAEDATAQNELRMLDADRAEALASLDRALADAGTPRPRMPDLTPEEAEAEALAQEHAAALAGSPDEAAGQAPPDSALAVERAMALLAAKTGVKPVDETAGIKPVDEAASVKPVGEVAGIKPVGEVAGIKPVGEDSAAGADAEARALAEAKAALEARQAAAEAEKAAAEADKAAAEAEKAAMAEEEKLAAAAKVTEARVIAEAKAAAAKAEEEEKVAAAKKAAEEKAAAEAAALAKAEAKEAHGTARELEDGPPVLAPSSPPAGEGVATLPAQPGGDPAENAGGADGDKKRPNLFSRMFGGDRESDAFAASRGKLPPPVAGKVVANYGQQHKSGATYRGMILRAGHSAPIKSVAGGKVSFAGNVPGLGNTVIVSHGGRYHTVYARLGSLEVKEGQSVASGTEVGTLPSDDADMHFELRDQGKAVDPGPWLKGGVPGAAP
jgi:septal ring factor EnvC (AmiA/AmiB activator)